MILVFKRKKKDLTLNSIKVTGQLVGVSGRDYRVYFYKTYVNQISKKQEASSLSIKNISNSDNNLPVINEQAKKSKQSQPIELNNLSINDKRKAKGNDKNKNCTINGEIIKIDDKFHTYNKYTALNNIQDNMDEELEDGEANDDDHDNCLNGDKNKEEEHNSQNKIKTKRIKM